jgi:superfamily II DNA or RNA helicase
MGLSMEFEDTLLLNRYFLNLLGGNSFDEIRANMVDKQEGYDSDGRSNFLGGIVNLKDSKIEDNVLIEYDGAIKEYVENLRHNRKQPEFNLKYFQYLAVLFSEIFFDKLFNNSTEFIKELNRFVDKINEEESQDFIHFTTENLKKIAFSIATGGGKTLIMHINYWQIRKYAAEDFDNIVLIPPNEGLSKQHFKEMTLSGIPCKLYDGNVDNIKTKPGEVLIIDIHKLIEEKTGEGVRVDVSYFDGKNLVFVDEGHKGSKSEDRVWKGRREDIARDGYILEYSATFRQVVVGNKQLTEEYGKSVIMEYSYKYFYNDGYGKDFYVYNLKENLYTEKFTDLILTANLMAYYEQLLIFEEQKRTHRNYNIERPLLTFIGGTVTGKIIKSDIPKIIFFFKDILEDKDRFEVIARKILDGKSGLIDNDGNDIFKDKFNCIKQAGLNIDDVYYKVFNGKGNLQLWKLKKTPDEIGLKTSSGEKYFGVISVDNVSSLLKLVEDDVEVRDENLLDSLFFSIDKDDSPINILVGSRKFMEGWDSWRVSCMGLLNIGRGKGPQIIQLFGRGVRLKGKNYSLKREETPDYFLNKLQTLNIFGLNADYINSFLQAINKEEVNFKEQEIKIEFNDPDQWNEKLYVIKIKDDFNFSDNIFRLSLNEEILSKVTLNMKPRVTLAHGLETEKARAKSDETKSIISFLDYIDWNRMYLEIVQHKTSKGYFNLLIDKTILKEIFKNEKYKIYATDEQMAINNFRDLTRIENYTLILLKQYVDRFYNNEMKRKSMDYLDVEKIDTKHDNLNFEKIILKIPAKLIQDFEDVFANLGDFYKKDVTEIPTIHFDNHLYSPLIVFQKGKEKIKSSPIKLNAGETKFVTDLRKYIQTKSDLLQDKKMFLLRNLSKKGIGFFQKTAGFYPDFILWMIEKDKQKMVFIDPKGIRNLGSFTDEKIQFCVSFIKDVEKKVKQKIEEKALDEELELDAYIISVSDYDSIKQSYGNPTEEEFEQQKILFQKGNYVEKLIKKLV